ncbi:twin-arginine translocation pathway signal [Mycobacterium sp. GA-1999]|nr:twin-arginine translocation pathway signal [Mycobacterium sp. IS-1556]KUH83216.1 twin-arginine translocation pathway signal [Mycobacterium sp. GA-0227b]KUH84374.1 twin-arginine translocation pathway signal [Mycobacterium sp. GA-1999]
MHDSPATPGRGGGPSRSRREVLRYAVSAPALLVLGTAGAAIRTPEASAESLRLADFATRLAPADQLKAAGFDGALVYVSELRPGADFDFKPVTREYADSLRAEGLHVVSCYQYGKPGWPTPSDYTRGYEGGVADAQTALRLHGAAGGPDSAPIFFSVDEDIDRDTWDSVAVEWYRGINSVLGAHRTGLYGHSRACSWAIEDEVIGRSTSEGHWWAWQTKAWSGGQRESRAVLYQAVVIGPSEPGVPVGDTHVDENEVLAPDFGQWGLDRA